MAVRKMNDGISSEITQKPETNEETTVSVFIPLLEDQGSEVAVDQTVNVTINGKVTQIRRGEHVEVKVPVFIQLRNRFHQI